MTAPRIDLSGLGKHKNNDKTFILVQHFQLLCLIWKHSTEETVVFTLQSLTRPRSQNLRWQSRSSGTFCPVTPCAQLTQRQTSLCTAIVSGGSGLLVQRPLQDAFISQSGARREAYFCSVTHQACHRRCTDSNWRPGGGCCCVCRHCLPLLTAKGSFPCPQLGTSVWPGIERAIGFTQEGKMTAVPGLRWDPFGGYIWSRADHRSALLHREF